MARPNNYNRRQKREREFDQKLVDIARVTRVVAGGRRFRFRATIVIGDRKGRVALGIAKGPDVSRAIEKANRYAKKHLVKISIVNDTIPHSVESKFGGARVLLKPARPGTGIIAGGAVRSVIELVGIKNIVSKMLGSANKANNVQATIKGLQSLLTPDELEDRRGVKIRGTFQRNQSLPEKRAGTKKNFKEKKTTAKKTS